MTKESTKVSPSAAMKEAAAKEKASPTKPAAPAKSFSKPKAKAQNVKQAAAKPAKGKNSKPTAKPSAKAAAVVTKTTKREDYLGSLVDAALERKKPQEARQVIEEASFGPAAVKVDRPMRPAPTPAVQERRETSGLIYNNTEIRAPGYAAPVSRKENRQVPSNNSQGRQSINPVIKIR